jgi:hypothetical protein
MFSIAEDSFPNINDRLSHISRKYAYIYDLPYIVVTYHLNLLRYIKDSGKPDALFLAPSNGDTGTIEVRQMDMKELLGVKGKIRRFTTPKPRFTIFAG